MVELHVYVFMLASAYHLQPQTGTTINVCVHMFCRDSVFQYQSTHEAGPISQATRLPTHIESVSWRNTDNSGNPCRAVQHLTWQRCSRALERPVVTVLSPVRSAFIGSPRNNKAYSARWVAELLAQLISICASLS